MRAVAVVALLLVELSGCANPANLVTAERYGQACAALQRSNQWVKAREMCGRALVNARVGGASERALAVAHYELGRASGAVCDYQLADQALKSALDLDRKTGGPTHMTLTELARMNVARGRIAEGIAYFDQAWSDKSLVERFRKETPNGYAGLLQEYAAAHDLLGNKAAAESARAEAGAVLAGGRGADVVFGRTPYGKHCG